jgi:hypothetical protein
MRAYDLNIFYEDLGDTVADTLTIEVNLYDYPLGGTSQHFVGVLFDCTVAETRQIAPDFPVEEYGHDWFIFSSTFADQCKAMPDRLAEMLKDLPDPNEVTTLEFWWDNWNTRKWITLEREADLRTWVANSRKTDWRV